ncbi:MAG: pyridoxal phosphate-dependent aminotransferase [Synergistaceae bacterium]|jgi:aspartate aminotransferase/aminotransferase|nr:pyridoxal phosphate-dependent aminotransferase [Synergistaceae bacterium]
MDYRMPKRNMRDIAYGGGIREILARADELQRSGRDILHMEIGRPDFDSPERAKQAAIRAIEAGKVHYTDMTGTPELRGEISAKYKRDAGIDVDPDTEVVVTAGAIEALMTALFAILDDGDEVIVPSPYFPVYDDQVKMAGGVVRRVQSRIEMGFRPQPDDIARAVSPKTKLIMINSPNNPTGAASTRSELEGIAEIAKKYDLLVLSDECYEKFTYDLNEPHVSIASLPGMRERTFTISAASKTFSMTGWRVGWLIHPPETRTYVMKCHQSFATCANSFAQAGVAEALQSCGPDVERMIAEYKRRRDLMVGMLSKIDGFDVPAPNGAFYVFPSIKALGVPSFEFCTRLLEESGVSTVPGQPFGVEDGYMRITYCRPENEIKEAMTRIADFVSRL